MKYFKQLSPWGTTLFLTIILSLIAVICDLVPVYLTKILFDVAYPKRDFNMLNLIAFMTLTLFCAKFFLNWCITILRESVSEEYLLQLRKKLFQHLCQLPLETSQKFSNGDLLIRLTDDTQAIEDLVITQFISILQQTCFMLLATVMAWQLSPAMTLLVLASFPLYLLEMKIFSAPMLHLQHQQIKAQSNVMDFLLDKLRHLPIIKAYNQEHRYSEKMATVAQHEYQFGIARNFLRTLTLLANSLTMQLWGVFVAWYLGTMVLNGKLSVGEMLSLLAILGQLGAPIATLSSLLLNWQSYAVSMQRVDEVMSLAVEAQAPAHDRSMPIALPLSLQIKNLNYIYPDGTRALDNCCLNIEGPGLFVIAGINGSGKSTLIQSLIGLRQKHSGKILFNGLDSDLLTAKQWRQMLAYVPQEGAIIHESIGDNLMLDLDVNEQQLQEILKQVGLQQFINHRLNGINSIVSDDVGFSVGQKQRLSLARALLKDSNIIIMDEPTAALDPETESEIRRTLIQLSKNKCLIVIAHHTAMFQAANKIFVMEAGRCVESGSYQGLLHSKGQFSQLLAQMPSAEVRHNHEFN